MEAFIAGLAGFVIGIVVSMLTIYGTIVLVKEQKAYKSDIKEEEINKQS